MTRFRHLKIILAAIVSILVAPVRINSLLGGEPNDFKKHFSLSNLRLSEPPIPSEDLEDGPIIYRGIDEGTERFWRSEGKPFSPEPVFATAQIDWHDQLLLSSPMVVPADPLLLWSDHLHRPLDLQPNTPAEDTILNRGPYPIIGPGRTCGMVMAAPAEDWLTLEEWNEFWREAAKPAAWHPVFGPGSLVTSPFDESPTAPVLASPPAPYFYGFPDFSHYGMGSPDDWKAMEAAQAAWDVPAKPVSKEQIFATDPTAPPPALGNSVIADEHLVTHASAAALINPLECRFFRSEFTLLDLTPPTAVLAAVRALGWPITPGFLWPIARREQI